MKLTPESNYKERAFIFGLNSPSELIELHCARAGLIKLTLKTLRKLERGVIDSAVNFHREDEEGIRCQLETWGAKYLIRQYGFERNLFQRAMDYIKEMRFFC